MSKRRDIGLFSLRNYIQDNSANISFAFSIIGFVFSLMLLVAVVGVLRGNGNILTLSGLLDILGDTYYIPIDWIFTISNVSAIDWGFYIGSIYVNMNWLRVVYDIISPIIQILLYLCTGIIQVFIFAIQFLRILFGY